MVSVIIPVYNVEQYLTKCLDSVLTQQGAEVEVLAINDGSTDASYEILGKYAKQYANLCVFSQSNQGVSVARNVGLDHARGDYILFVDPDDWLEPMAVSRLLELMKAQPCDIIGFNCTVVNEYGEKTEFKRIKRSMFYDLSDSRQYIALFAEHGLKTVAWDCFFKADLLRALRFESYPNGEDTLFSFRAFLHASTVLFTPEICYNYYKRAGTASMRSSLLRDVSVIKVIGRCAVETINKARVPRTRRELLKKLRNWLCLGHVFECKKLNEKERNIFVDAWIKSFETIWQGRSKSTYCLWKNVAGRRLDGVLFKVVYGYARMRIGLATLSRMTKKR